MLWRGNCRPWPARSWPKPAAPPTLLKTRGPNGITVIKQWNPTTGKYDDTGGTPSLVYNNDLGDLGPDGTVTGMVRTSAGRLYVAGSTSNAALDAIVTTAHHGDLDGYVLSLQDNGASASAQFVSYTGTLFEDHINGIALDAANGNDVYVTGAITADTLKLYALGLPALLAGLWAGFKLYGKLDGMRYNGVWLFAMASGDTAPAPPVAPPWASCLPRSSSDCACNRSSPALR